MIHEIPENKDEDTDALKLEVINTKMEIKIMQNHIYKTHKINKLKSKGNPRPVITKFVWYNGRKKAFSNKKLLKDSGASILKSLTAFRKKDE